MMLLFMTKFMLMMMLMLLVQGSESDRAHWLMNSCKSGVNEVPKPLVGRSAVFCHNGTRHRRCCAIADVGDEW